MNDISHCDNAKSGALRFGLGAVYATPGALACMEECSVSAATLLHRHQHGDWGDICEADRLENQRSIAHGWRIMSSYSMSNGERIWVITEADRSATTLLLPSEY